MYKKITKNTLKYIGISIISIVLGFSGSLLIEAKEQESISNREEAYSFLSKRLLYENPNDVQFDFKGLRTQLESEVYDVDTKAGSIGVYFEFLPNNVSVTINPDFEAVPASMLKTVTAMHTMLLVEEGEISLDQEVVLTNEMLNDGYGELYKSGAGSSFTVEELLKTMLQESDNTAALALRSLLKPNQDTINFLEGIDAQAIVDEQNNLYLTPESYSHIFKCLYFACYNNKDHSQYILSVLNETNYDERLTKLLPESTRVSHKFGSFEGFQSDCGIVYANQSNSNYVLCVMVNGNDPEASQKIARISYKVHSHVESLVDEQPITPQ